MSRFDILAIPKGSSSFCEICKKSSIIKCSKCLTTFYCSEEHKILDESSFHPLVCADYLILRGEQPFPIEEADRKIMRDELKRKLIEIQKKAGDVAKEYALKDEGKLAYAPAMQAFHLAQDLYGDQSLETVPSYDLLAEVYLSLGETSMAQNYMEQAAFTVEKHDEVPVDVLADVLRMKGKVYLHKKFWERANYEFAEYIYCLAEKSGVTDIQRATGCGYLGLTLKELNPKIYVAMDLFDKMAKVWLDHLLDLYIAKNLKVPTEKDKEDRKVRVQEQILLEAQYVFRLIDKSLQNIKDNFILSGFVFKLFSIQAILCLRENNEEKKKTCCDAALQLSVLKKMDDAVKPEKTKYLFEILGDDYLARWDKKHGRDATIATKYLEHVKELLKK